MDEFAARSFGRIEAQLDQVLGKLDRHGERLAEHGVRLAHVEADVEELKTVNHDGVRQGMTFRTGLSVALLGAGTSGVIGLVLNLINSKGG